MASTSTRHNVYLLGVRDIEPLTRFNQLPTLRQVLLRLDAHLNHIKSVRNASYRTIDELNEVWAKAWIPTKKTFHSVEKLEKTHSQWLLLKKNKRRTSATQKSRELLFVEQLDKLFDVAHVGAMSMIKIQQDRDFLEDQRTQRKMIITYEDTEFNKKHNRILERIANEERRSQKVVPHNTIHQDVNMNNVNSSTDEESDVGPVYKPTTNINKPNVYQSLIPKDIMFTPQVTSSLDRNKISDRQALRLMVPLVAALGHDPSIIPISRSTIHRKRHEARKICSDEIKGAFSMSGPIIVHWDGKILPDILRNEKVDRLPVLVCSDGVDKLLGVPKLEAGTGLNATEAIHDVLEKWNLLEQIQGMCFDTTSVNTGRLNGACTLLENKIGRDLLWLACRHHVLEIILSKVFAVCFGPSNSPEISIFKRFKAVWGKISCNDYSGLELNQDSVNFKNSTVTSLSSALECMFPRDDYMELTELSLIVLGEKLPKIHWRAPGPVHHARWMAKLIYAYKIFLFRDQNVFYLTPRQKIQLERFVKFGSLLYSKNWIEAPLAADAPLNDLTLWKDAVKYKDVDEEISQAVQKVLINHLWYLSDELIGLSLFSDKVTVDEKSEIVKHMSSNPKPRMVRGDPAIIKVADPVLAKFATKRSYDLLKKLQINNDFLNIPPDEWETHPEFIKGVSRIKMLKVVNDVAERGVKLFDEFNKLITNNEEEKQFLLQVVEANRKSIHTKATKSEIIDSVIQSSTF